MMLGYGNNRGRFIKGCPALIADDGVSLAFPSLEYACTRERTEPMIALLHGVYSRNGYTAVVARECTCGGDRTCFLLARTRTIDILGTKSVDAPKWDLNRRLALSANSFDFDALRVMPLQVLLIVAIRAYTQYATTAAGAKSCLVGFQQGLFRWIFATHFDRARLAILRSARTGLSTLFALFSLLFGHCDSPIKSLCRRRPRFLSREHGTSAETRSIIATCEAWSNLCSLDNFIIPHIERQRLRAVSLNW